MAIGLNTLLDQIRRRLFDAKIEQPNLEARLLLKHVLKLTDADFIADKDLSVGQAKEEQIIEKLVRRLSGEPLSRILGECEFWSLPFAVTPDVLDPRPDSETIIETALKLFAVRPPARILDLGTGSGCLLVTLLHAWPQARGLGIDMSLAALDVAAGNARRNDVASRAVFQQGDWGSHLNEKFDLIVSNPPYIRTGDIPHLESGVRDFDPILALDGGEDGFAAYIRLVDEVKKLLASGGVALLEVGQGQATEVMRLGAVAGFSRIDSYRDLAGIDRVVAWHMGTSEIFSAAPLPARESGG